MFLERFAVIKLSAASKNNADKRAKSKPFDQSLMLKILIIAVQGCNTATFGCKTWRSSNYTSEKLNTFSHDLHDKSW